MRYMDADNRDSILFQNITIYVEDYEHIMWFFMPLCFVSQRQWQFSNLKYFSLTFFPAKFSIVYYVGTDMLFFFFWFVQVFLRPKGSDNCDFVDSAGPIDERSGHELPHKFDVIQKGGNLQDMTFITTATYHNFENKIQNFEKKNVLVKYFAGS